MWQRDAYVSKSELFVQLDGHVFNEACSVVVIECLDVCVIFLIFKAHYGLGVRGGEEHFNG